MNSEKKPTITRPTHRTADYVCRPSNNVQFEAYGTDLKVLFGLSDMGAGEEEIQQHTGIVMSWPEAKLLAYFLQAQLLVYEGALGQPIPLHSVNFPPAVEASELSNTDDVLQKLRELHKRMFPKR